MLLHSSIRCKKENEEETKNNNNDDEICFVAVWAVLFCVHDSWLVYIFNQSLAKFFNLEKKSGLLHEHARQLITLRSLKCVVNGALAYSVFAGEKKCDTSKNT